MADAGRQHGVLAASQRAIVNMYTLIALVYCAASTWLFFGPADVPAVAWVHLVTFVVIAINYAVLQRTQDFDLATHVILSVGTAVVSSLYATGGWAGTGFLWTFAYLPYAFFLASERIARFWVAVLVVVDLGLLLADATGALAVPYGPVGHAMFYASLGVFLLCMFLFKRAVLRSEATAQLQADQLAAANVELRRRELELSTAQRVARLGSFLWDPAVDRTTWTAPLAELFGVEPTAEPVNLAAFRTMVHPEDLPRFDAAWDGLVRHGRPVEIDCRFTRRDGTLRSLHIRARREGDGGDRVLGTAQDVTEVRQAEEERRLSSVRLQEIEGLKEVNRFKTQFLNTAAHELATPLTPIRLQLHNLKGAVRDVGPERREHAVELLERNVARLGSLVQDLLEGARLQSSQLAIERKPVDLAKVVRDSVRNQQVVANDRGIALVLEAADGPLWTTGDERRLAQVVDNLLSNALKFTPAGKAITVRCARASGGLAVFVRDEGLGIAADKLPRLFQPFSQVHDTSQQTRPGTGLGLYICKGIVEAHGGRIGVESPGLGHGATFWFVLGEGDRPAPVAAA